MPTVGTGKKKRTFKYTKAGKMKAAKYAKKMTYVLLVDL